MTKYYSMEKSNKTATITIYGDICSYPWTSMGEMSSYNLSRQLQELTDVDRIDVHINSYGGEVAEGLAIYNALLQHPATVRTICDGFACSISSVIFMAGDERVMNEASLLMIHNAWSYVSGNAGELRKAADDMDKITQASVKAYLAHSNLDEATITRLMDEESWILPEEALEYGFATSIQKTETAAVSQNARRRLCSLVEKYRRSEEPGTGDVISTPAEDGADRKEEPEDNPAQYLDRLINAIANMK